MPTFYCSAILFDLDGVLVDSTRSVTRQWRIWAKDNGIDPEKLLEIAHGRRTAETVRLLAPHLAAEEEARMLETLRPRSRSQRTRAGGLSPGSRGSAGLPGA